MVTLQHIDTDLLSLSADLECVDGNTVLGKLDWTREYFGEKQQLVTQINIVYLESPLLPYS